MASIADPRVQLVSDMHLKKDPDSTRTQMLTAILKDEINSAGASDRLRKKLFLGLMPQVISGALQGFEKLIYIDSVDIKAKPISLYGETIAKIIFFKTNISTIKFLSAYYNSKDELVCLYPDDD
jgi:hypothetical protein